MNQQHNIIKQLSSNKKQFLSKFESRKKKVYEDFPGDPVAKTSPSNADRAGLIPGQGAKIPPPSSPKNKT